MNNFITFFIRSPLHTAWFAAVLAIILLAGCATVRDFTKGNPDECVFAYGYITGDMGAASRITLVQVTPRDQRSRYSTWSVNGYFIQGNLGLGAYQLGEFSADMSVVDLGWAAPGFHMEKAGVYFLGAFKLKRKGIFSNEFSLEKIDSPDEIEVLKKAAYLARESGWEPRLLERLKNLEVNR